jgi:transposase
MDRDRLKAYLDQGMSLPQIGEVEGRHPSTVGYWVEKHGLVANGKAKYAPRGGLTRQQLEPLVESGATLQEMADALSCGINTIRYWIAKYELKLRNRRRGRRPSVPRELVEAALANDLRTVDGECRVHGPSVFVIENSRRVRCRKCRQQAVVDWRRRTKRKLVEEAGGCCALCGYHRCMAALQFHHVDPAGKAFSMSRQGVTRSLRRAREEAGKCVLLCANCHAMVEAGLLDLAAPADHAG